MSWKSFVLAGKKESLLTCVKCSLTLAGLANKPPVDAVGPTTTPPGAIHGMILDLENPEDERCGHVMPNYTAANSLISRKILSI
jgi:hypothetical protein